MSNILTYPLIPIVAGDDMMIISDVSIQGNPTRSVNIDQLSAYISTGGADDGVHTTVLGVYPILATSGPGQNSVIVSIAADALQGALTLSTNGSSGPSTLIGNTLNIPQYSGESSSAEQIDRFMLTGLIKNLGAGGDGTVVLNQAMEWTSAGNGVQVPLWRTPTQVRLTLVTWAYMGATPMTFATTDQLNFKIGSIPLGADPIFANFSLIDTMFTLNYTNSGNGKVTRPQGQIDVSSQNIILSQFSNIAVIMTEPAASDVSPKDGDIAICLYFESTAEAGAQTFSTTLTQIVDNVVYTGLPASSYSIGGNSVGDFVQGVTGTSYSFTNQVIPASGYQVTGATATNPNGVIGTSDTSVINSVGGTITEIARTDFTVTMTPLVNNIVNNDNVAFTLSGDIDGATRVGSAGTLYAFNTGIGGFPNGYYINNFTATNPNGTISANASVQQTLAGEIVSKGATNYTVTLNPLTDNIVVPGGSDGGTPDGFGSVPDPVYYTLGGDLAGSTETGAVGDAYSFTTTVTLATGYEWRSGPSITNPSGVHTASNFDVAQVITGEIQASDAPQFTVTLNPLVDNITIPAGRGGDTSLYYTITGASQGDSVTGPTGTQYNFLNSITMASGFSIQNFNPNNINGTIGSSNINRSKSITGTVIADTASSVTVTLKLSDQIADTNPPNYTITGDSNNATVTGAPGNSYSFTTGVTMDTGFSINNFNSTDPSGTIPTSDIDIGGALTGTVVADQATDYVVTLQYVNNIVGTSNGYVISGDNNGSSVTGPTGTSYSFSNALTLVAGYEWATNPTITNPSGTIQGANQTVSQVFTGSVQLIPGDPGEIWRITRPTDSGDCIEGTYTNINGTISSFLECWTELGGYRCICVKTGTVPSVTEWGTDGSVEKLLVNGSSVGCNSTGTGSCPT